MANKLEKIAGTLALAGALSFNAYSQNSNDFDYLVENKSELEYLKEASNVGLKNINDSEESKKIVSSEKDSEKDPFYRAMQGTFLGLNIADYLVTDKALKEGAEELNPVAKNFEDDKALFLGYKAATTGLSLFLVDKMYEDNPKFAKGFLLGANILYGAILANNISVSIKMGK